jgi:hypothetical protein
MDLVLLLVQQQLLLAELFYAPVLLLVQQQLLLVGLFYALVVQEQE